jgi:hypothetical protein
LPTGVVRDFIPEGSELTREEKVRFDNLRNLMRGGIRQDFVPDKKHRRLPGQGRASAADEALERALQRQATAAQAEFNTAVERLQNMSVAEAIALIAQMPVSQQELYLVAEEATGKREDILSMFPKPDPAVRERFINDAS